MMTTAHVFFFTHHITLSANIFLVLIVGHTSTDTDLFQQKLKYCELWVLGLVYIYIYFLLLSSVFVIFLFHSSFNFNITAILLLLLVECLLLFLCCCFTGLFMFFFCCCCCCIFVCTFQFGSLSDPCELRETATDRDIIDAPKQIERWKKNIPHIQHRAE